MPPGSRPPSYVAVRPPCRAFVGGACVIYHVLSPLGGTSGLGLVMLTQAAAQKQLCALPHPGDAGQRRLGSKAGFLWLSVSGGRGTLASGLCPSLGG